MSSLHYANSGRPKSTPINAELVFLEGDCIVVPDGYVFPRVCLVTGVHVDTPPREVRFARTKYISEVDRTPGNIDALFAGHQRDYFGPKSRTSFCLNARLAKRRSNLAIGYWMSLIVAVPVPLALLATTGNPISLLLFFLLMILAGACLWQRDSIIRSTKVTPSYIWLAGVKREIREAIYAAGKGSSRRDEIDAP